MITLPSGRITTKSCEYYAQEGNEALAIAGIDLRFEVSPRNGYCAVDLYRHSIRSDKENPKWSIVDRNLQCGTPRECCEAIRDEYYRAIDAAEK